MKAIAIASALTLAVCSSVLAAEGWMTDFAAAKEKAAKENKSLLIDFTGSDWCGWCIRLREEVFDHEEFSKGVADHFVLVELDFPNDKSKMSAETIAQNEKLQEKYQVQGFPTIYLTDPQGRPFGRTGYQEGGPEAYLTHLATFREKLAVRDEALAKAEKAEGEERAAALSEALEAVPQESIPGFYADELAKLEALDPDSDLVATVRRAAAEAKFEAELNELFGEKRFDEVVKRVDEAAKEQKLEGEELQQMLAYKVNAYMAAEDLDSAIKVLDEVTAIDPSSRIGQGAAQFKLQLLARKAAKMKEEAEEEGEKDTSPQKMKEEAEEEGAQDTGQVPAPGAMVPVSTTVEVGAEGNVVQVVEVEVVKVEEGEEAPEAAASEKELRVQLQAARREHEEVVRVVNGTHEKFERLEQELKAQRERMVSLERALDEARAAAQQTERQIKEVESVHATAHQREEVLSKTIANHEGELQRLAQIAELEKQARDLQKRAEQLRRKAEELKSR